MAWWLQGDLQPFAHFRSGMGRSPRPPEAGATSEARGFRRSRNGLRPYFRFAGDDR